MKIGFAVLLSLTSLQAELTPRIAPLTAVPISSASNEPPPLFPADYDQDGLMDFIIGPDSDEKYWLHLNQGNAEFSQREELGLLPSDFLAEKPNLTVAGFTVGDIDQDGDPDLVINYLDTNSVDFTQDRAICLSALNNGDGSFSLPSSLPLPFVEGYLSRSCATIDLFDWDQDGDLDLIDSTIGWRENTGEGEFSTNTRFLVPPGVAATDAFGNPTIIASNISFGDVNGDGNPDILTSLFAYESNGQRFTIDPATGNLILVPESLYPDSSERKFLAAILLSDALGRITQALPIPLELATSDAFGNPVVVGPTFLSDLDQDGLADIVSVSPASDAFGNPISLGSRWIRSQGGEAPFPYTSFLNVTTIPSIWGPLRDFDGNGTLEHSGPTSFVAPTIYGPEYSPAYDFIGSGYELSFSGILEDFDGDGDLDSIYYQDSEENHTYFLVRNLIIDETSGVTFAMRELGILGDDANPSSDPDNDGKSNFEELILGCEPQLSDNSGDLTRIFPTLTSSQDLQFSVNKKAKDAGITYRLEYSADMSEWQPAEAVYFEDEDAIWETWQAVPNDIPRCFFRLVIEP